jgi:hypothetical protein
MRFRFELKTSNCCGGPGKQTYTSTTYCLATNNVEHSFLNAYQQFYSNYHVKPLEIIVQTSELELLQQSVAADLSYTNGQLKFRTIPITVEE